MIKFLFVFIGGGLGSLLRFQFSIFFSRHTATVFPWSTFCVNVAGCFLIGLFYALSLKYTPFSIEWRLLLITGFCGGFTTFSTFAYENVMLLKEGNTIFFILYSTSSFALCLLSVLAGLTIIKLF